MYSVLVSHKARSKITAQFSSIWTLILRLGEKNYILRVGALMFHAVGQLSTHQMAQFHSKTAIYPVGYKATRIYWSSNVSPCKDCFHFLKTFSIFTVCNRVSSFPLQLFTMHSAKNFCANFFDY